MLPVDPLPASTLDEDASPVEPSAPGPEPAPAARATTANGPEAAPGRGAHQEGSVPTGGHHGGPRPPAGRPAGRTRPPPPPPADGRNRAPAPGQIRPTNGKSGKLPPQLSLTEVQTLVERERQEALAVRDPIAIALAAERFNTLATILADLPAQEAVDLYRPLLTVSQTAKMLGYNAKEVRRLLGQGKIAGRKVGNEWRIPLWAVL